MRKHTFTLYYLKVCIFLTCIIGLPSCGEKGFKKFRCVGMEPFWSVLISDYERLAYYAPGVEEQWQPAKITIFAEQCVYETVDFTGSPVKITIIRQVCNDSMSEKLYQYAVTLEKNGKIFRGCGEVQE